MEKLKKIAKLEYLFFAYNLGFLLYVLLSIPSEVVLTGKYLLLVLAGSVFVALLAGYVCWRKKVRPSVTQGLFVGFLLCLAVVSLYHFTQTGIDNASYLVLNFCVCLPCFLTFLGFSKEQHLAQWQWIAVGYNFIIGLVSLVSIYCTYADVYLLIPAIGWKYITFNGLNLYVFGHYNNVAQSVGVAMLLAIFMICTVRKLWVRIVFMLSFVLSYITVALAYSRSANLTFAACIAITVCYFIWRSAALQQRWSLVKSVLLRIVICAVACVGIIVAGYVSMVFINTQTLSYRIATREANGTEQQLVTFALNQTEIEEEIAEDGLNSEVDVGETDASETGTDEADEDTAQSTDTSEQMVMTEDFNDATRSITELSNIGTRVDGWVTIIEYLKNHLEYAFWGVSPAGVSILLGQIIEHGSPHAHNVFVQVLTALGVIGFLCFMALWGLSIARALKAFFVGENGFAFDCLPFMIIAAFTALGMQEAMMFATETYVVMPVFFMACASTACLARLEKEE